MALPWSAKYVVTGKKSTFCQMFPLMLWWYSESCGHKILLPFVKTYFTLFLTVTLFIISPNSQPSNQLQNPMGHFLELFLVPLLQTKYDYILQSHDCHTNHPLSKYTPQGELLWPDQQKGPVHQVVWQEEYGEGDDEEEECDFPQVVWPGDCICPETLGSLPSHGGSWGAEARGQNGLTYIPSGLWRNGITRRASHPTEQKQHSLQTCILPISRFTNS